MSLALLDINDSNLQLWHGDTHLQSPGYAMLEGGGYQFGQAAREAARLRPREVNTRYWWQLSTEALQPAMGPARHTADLVHAHLQALHREGGQPGEVLLAVSGSMQRDQLSLLLGIVQQCPFDAVGLVNRSVALGSLYGGGRLFHLEIQLHQSVISELEAHSGTVDLGRTVPLPGCGLLQLQERLVERVAAAFIRQTRFDPRRKAVTEQALYDALPAALRVLSTDAETSLEINGYRARVSAAELAEAGQPLFDSAQDVMGVLRPDDHFLADPLAGLLPGLADRFPRLDVMHPLAVRDALRHHQERLVEREQALSFVTSLPCLELQVAPRGEMLAESATNARPKKAQPEPTHILRGARAERLDANGTALGGGCTLMHDTGGWRISGDGPTPLVNGKEYEPGQRLACGDRVHFAPGGAEALLIEVPE